jgi:hypothetical protein
MKKIYGIVLIIVIAIVSSHCDKIKSYSSVPAITFDSYQLLDTVDELQNKMKKLVINFKFVDGDGDLFNPDTVANANSKKSKLFLIFYEKKDGVFVQVPDSLLLTPLAFRLPYDDVMKRDGQNKTQKGTISYSYPFYYPMPFDTLEVKFYITDMAEQQSDTAQIPNEIVLK